MKIISNERYKKLEALERWEDVKIMRGISSSPPNDHYSNSENIAWLLESKIPEFLKSLYYRKDIKKEKGEIGSLFGRRIIVK